MVSSSSVRQSLMVTAVMMLALSTSLGQERKEPQLLVSVVDPSGAAIPNATLSLKRTNDRSQPEATAITDQTGQAFLPLHLWEDYDLIIAAQGFRSAKLHSDGRGGPTQMRIELSVGSFSGSDPCSGSNYDIGPQLFTENLPENTLLTLPYPNLRLPRKLLLTRRYLPSKGEAQDAIPRPVTSTISTTMPPRYKETVTPEKTCPELISGQLSICDPSGAPIPGAEVAITQEGVPVVRLTTDEKGQAGLGLIHRQLVGTGLTVSAPAFTSVNFRVSDGRIDAMDLALNIQEGDRILVTPTPVDSGTASLTDIPVSGTVRAKSGKPISSAHVQVRFTKADGLCACKWPKQTLTSDRHGEFGLRLPRLGQFEFCASVPNLHVRCLTIDAKRGDPEQKITLTLLR